MCKFNDINADITDIVTIVIKIERANIIQFMIINDIYNRILKYADIKNSEDVENVSAVIYLPSSHTVMYNTNALLQREKFENHLERPTNLFTIKKPLKIIIKLEYKDLHRLEVNLKI